jgi:uncharacterized protein DUF4328
VVACSRCGTAAKPGTAWCGECGLALAPPSGLPTPEAFEAAAREQHWIAEREGGTGRPRSSTHPEQPPAPAPRSPWPPRPSPPQPVARYKPIAVRAHVLRWWLAAGVAVGAVVTVLNAIHLSILDADSFAGSEAVAASDDRLAAGGAALVATFLVSTLLWLAWFHRAYRNLESLEPIAPRFGTGWAVGAWFVPILNLFRPKQIANDIWRGTDPEPPRGRAWTDRPVAPLVHWWWVSWLVASVLGNLSARLLSDARTLGQERAAVLLDIAAGISYVVAGVLAVLFVRAVTEREAARAVAVAGAETDAERVRADREGGSRRRLATVALSLAGAAALVLSVALAAPSRTASGMRRGGYRTSARWVSSSCVRATASTASPGQA